MKKIFILLILITAFGWILPHSFGQTAPVSPQILLTWKANTYVPDRFSGKVMPAANSQITASVELIDGGRIMNISGQNIYWYADNNFIDGGIGKQSVTFRAPDVAGGSIDIRAEIPNYSRGRQFKTVTIPIVKPHAVIEAPFPSGKFSSSPLNLVALPYFFNVTSISQLNFAWNVNGQTPSGAENPQNLNVKFEPTLPSGSVISVSLSIGNPSADFETATKKIDITYAP
ncbi:MAG: hypothetical protein HY432_03925 [Candidatus Liptonbacteria bacterium]|nr:hypothetical protein [Candidatus Liptonbacteria bacterium]